MQTQTTAQPEHNQHAVKFHGSIAECFKIWFTNLFLIIITLGIYSFWAIIKMKRFFYQNTEINGYHFDFHAKPIQYIKGFLIVIAFYAAFIFLEFKAPNFAGLLLLVGLGCLPWLIIKSWQFQMRMTSLNGVRFDFKGNLGTAYWVLLFAPVLFILGLVLVFSLIFSLTFSGNTDNIGLGQIIFGGLLVLLFLASFPIIFAILNIMQLQFFVNHSIFGNQYFQTTLKKGKMIAIHCISWLIQLPFLIWGGSIYINATMEFVFRIIYVNRYYDSSQIVLEYFLSLVPAFLIIFLGCFLTSIYRITTLRNYLFSQTTINGLQLKSTMQIIPFFWLIISNLFIVIFTLGLCSPIAHIRMARYIANSTYIIGDFNIDDATANVDEDDSVNTEPVVDAILGVM